MSLVDLRPFTLPQGFGQLATEDLIASNPAFSLSDISIPLSDEDLEEVRTTLRAVVEMLSKTAGAAGSMRRRLGIVMDCLLAVADELDGDPDLEDGADQEATCEDEGAQCEDEGAPDDSGIADTDALAEQRGTRHLYGGYVT